MLYCHITSRVKGDSHDQQLLEKGGRGFPYIVVMDENGGVLHPHMSSRDLAGFRRSVEKAKSLQQEMKALDARAEDGDMSARVRVFELRLKRRLFDAEEARRALKYLSIDEKRRKELDSRVTDLKVREIEFAATSIDEMAAHYLELKEQGHVPASDREWSIFWHVIHLHAEGKGDPELFETSLEKLKERFGDRPKFRAYEATRRAILEKLTRGGRDPADDPTQGSGKAPGPSTEDTPEKGAGDPEKKPRP